METAAAAERDSSMLGNIFQQIITDLKVGTETKFARTTSLDLAL